MKSLFVLTISGLLACSGIARAADTTPTKKGGDRQYPGLEQRVEMMKKQLELTPEQETKLKALFAEEAKTMRESRDEMANLTQEQRREKMMAHRKEVDAKLKEILTPEQQEKWQKMRQERSKGPGKGQPGQKNGKKNGKKSE